MTRERIPNESPLIILPTPGILFNLRLRPLFFASCGTISEDHAAPVVIPVTVPTPVGEGEDCGTKRPSVRQSSATRGNSVPQPFFLADSGGRYDTSCWLRIQVPANSASAQRLPDTRHVTIAGFGQAPRTSTTFYAARTHPKKGPPYDPTRVGRTEKHEWCTRFPTVHIRPSPVKHDSSSRFPNAG